jgi:rubrerythrin
LKAEPAGTVRSLDELFALAYVMGQEAATRYRELAIEMGGQGKQDLAVLFRQLESVEREHVNSVIQLSESRNGRKPDPSLVHWKGPETFDHESIAEIFSLLMTPYRALSIAVRGEQRRFVFWSYVDAHAGLHDIKEAAEAMAREALERVSILRKERRRSYHSVKRPLRHDRDASRQIDAGALEQRLSEHLTELANRIEGSAAHRAHELAQESKHMSAAAAGFGRFLPEIKQCDPQMIAESLVDAYLEGAGAAAHADSLTSLQKLAERAIARLAWLRSLG